MQLAGVPTVPIGIRGTAALMPRENTGIRPGTIEVFVGEPIPPIPQDDNKARSALMKRVREDLSRLAGVPMVDPERAGGPHPRAPSDARLP